MCFESKLNKVDKISATDNDTSRIIRVCIAFKMDEFLGKRYVLVDSENFEDYLMFIGMGYFSRKVAMKLNQTKILTRNDDGTYTFQLIAPMANTTITFTSGEGFEELKADGTKVKAVVTIADNIMIHVETDGNGKRSQHIREFYADKMTVTTTAQGFDKIVKRNYVVERLPVERTMNQVHSTPNTSDICSEPAASPSGDATLPPPPHIASVVDVTARELSMIAGSDMKLIMEELRAVRAEIQVRKEMEVEMMELKTSLNTCNTRIDGLEARVDALERRASSGPANPGAVDRVVEELRRELNDRDQDLLANDIERTQSGGVFIPTSKAKGASDEDHKL